MEIVINAMKDRAVQPGTKVITEGEEGTNLFVVNSGSLTCTKNEAVIKKYESGDVFGELALLYNCKRAASITSDTDCQLFVLDRETFNHIVKDSMQKKREKYEDFLSKAPILTTMEPYERSYLCEALAE